MTNLRSNLRRSSANTGGARSAMVAFDRLPAALRQWTMFAALPWSAASVLRQWRRALKQSRGDSAAALLRLTATEQRCLARDSMAAVRPLPRLPPLRQG